MSGVVQNVLAPAGVQAARIGRLWWWLLAATAAVYLATMITLLLAVARARRSGPTAEPTRDDAPMTPILRPPEPGERRLARWVAVATGLTVAILLAILVASTATGRALASLDSPHPLRIQLVGHQWWWEVKYLDPSPQMELTTANEIHLPVGRPVAIQTDSRDVIHSFWVPSLTGKRDLIPGRPSVAWLRADRPGVFRGQCAEFCGYQHAHMALQVIAEAPERFTAWEDAERRPAATPVSPLARRGQQVFGAVACPLCHTIHGTEAQGQLGPDLTHLAARRTIAAGTLPLTAAALARWIADPQRVKPGTSMPPTPLAPDDREALVAYLESLR